jgi:hypothetical protein
MSSTLAKIQNEINAESVEIRIRNGDLRDFNTIFSNIPPGLVRFIANHSKWKNWAVFIAKWIEWGVFSKWCNKLGLAKIGLASEVKRGDNGLMAIKFYVEGKTGHQSHLIINEEGKAIKCISGCPHVAMKEVAQKMLQQEHIGYVV